MSSKLNPVYSSFSKWIKRKSENKVIVFIFLLLFICFNAFVFPFFISQYGLENQIILDLSPGFSPDLAYDTMHSYGVHGRKGVLIITGVVDMIYPLIYSMLLMFVMSRLKSFAPKFLNEIKQFFLIPLLIFLFDFLENISILTMIKLFPNRNDPISLAASFFGMLKWSFVLLCILIILVLTFRYTKTRIQSKKK